MDNKIECEGTFKNLHKSHQLFLSYFFSFYLELKKKSFISKIPFFLK